MKRDPRSTSRMRRLKPRQRKKLRVGEFQEHCFDVELVFHSPMRGEPYHEFINDFFGALDQFKAGKGLFVTTSSFSPSAVSTAAGLSKRIVLIDGQQLTRLMIKYEVGCRVEEQLAIKRIDEEFFDL